MADARDAAQVQDLGRLRWRCRRGMKELDTVLVRYLDGAYGTASAEDQGRFRALLELQDPELAAFVLGRATPEDPALADFIRHLASTGPRAGGGTAP